MAVLLASDSIVRYVWAMLFPVEDPSPGLLACSRQPYPPCLGCPTTIQCKFFAWEVDAGVSRYQYTYSAAFWRVFSQRAEW
jgi:hypothetical protein